MTTKHLRASIGETSTEHLPRRLLQRGWIKVRRGKINHRNTPTGREPGMGHINHARAWLRGELAQDERHHDEPSGSPFRARVNRARMQMCREAVGDQLPTRTF